MTIDNCQLTVMVSASGRIQIVETDSIRLLAICKSPLRILMQVRYKFIICNYALKNDAEASFFIAGIV